MICRTASRSVFPEPPSFPGVMVAAWAMLAAVGVVGLASTPPPAGGEQGRVAPSAVPTAFTATVSSGSLAVALTLPAQPATPSPAAPAGVARPASPAANNAAADHVAVALRAALAQIGLPYVWGGNGPSDGDAGFDCSGLTHFAYAAAGIALPRTAHTQFYAGPHVPAGAPLQPGDLVFYGTPTFVHHVGMYVGAGRMVNAPTFGEPVQIAYYRWPGDDYIGATRPDGSSATGLLTLPFIPEAAGPSPVFPAGRKSDVFAAPPAPLPVVQPALGAVPVPQAQQAAAAIATVGPTPPSSVASLNAIPTTTPSVSRQAPVTAIPPATTSPHATAVLPSPAAAPTKKKAPAAKVAPIVTTTPPTRTTTAPPSSAATSADSPDPTTPAAAHTAPAVTTTTTPTPTPTP